MLYNIDINDRAFLAIINNKKKIEIRANNINDKINYSEIKENDIIKFKNSKEEIIVCKVIENNFYSTIEELLTIEGTRYTLSSTNDFSEGIKSINSLNGYKQAIKENGVYAIHIKYLYSENDKKNKSYIKIEEKDKITRGAGTQHSIDNYLTKDKVSNVSIAVSHLYGKIPKTKNIESDRIYYFINANATFNIEDECVKVRNGDMLYITKNTFYSVEGIFDAVLINTPAFDIENEKTE